MNLPAPLIVQGDALRVLRAFPENSVHCIVTSPPYWALRDYGTGKWEGGSADCDHKKVSAGQASIRKSTLGGPNRRTVSGQKNNGHQQEGYRGKCGKCGARRIDEQLGLEDTPEEYVEKMTKVFLEARRVLRADGTLWLNIGDCYAGSWGAQGHDEKHMGKHSNIGGAIHNRTVFNRSTISFRRDRAKTGDVRHKDAGAGIKPKDLVGIPWMLAFSLRASGWWLRSEIIWAKTNPMPESITDRPTKAHEQIFLLSKSKRYYYDADAIREPLSPDTHARRSRARTELTHAPGQLPHTGLKDGGPPKQKIPAGWDTSKGGHRTGAGRYNKAEESPNGLVRDRVVMAEAVKPRNRRSVWTVSTQGYPDAHFATFPEALIEPCILAGCPEGGTVLDPFAGTATVGVVALRHRRTFLGIELKPEYIELANLRLAKPDQIEMQLQDLLAEASASVIESQSSLTRTDDDETEKET